MKKDVIELTNTQAPLANRPLDLRARHAWLTGMCATKSPIKVVKAFGYHDDVLEAADDQDPYFAGAGRGVSEPKFVTKLVPVEAGSVLTFSHFDKNYGQLVFLKGGSKDKVRIWPQEKLVLSLEKSATPTVNAGLLGLLTCCE